MGAIFHNGDYVGNVPPIDDSSVSDKTLWSSEKINNEITENVERVVTPVDVAFTMASGFTNSSDRTRVIKIGNLCTAIIVMTSSSALSTGSSTTALTVASGNRPSAQVFACIACEDKTGIVQINSSGEIKVEPKTGQFPASKGIFGQISWIVDK